MDVEEILRKAKDALEAADLPDELRVVGFEKAVELIASRPPQSTAPMLAPPGSPTLGSSAGDNAKLNAIAQRTGATIENVAHVFSVDGDEPILDIPPSRLPTSTKRAVQQLTVIATATRQAIGQDSGSVSYETILATGRAHGVHDSNFSKNVNSTSEWLNINGTGDNRRFRVRHASWQTIGEWIDELGGGGTA